MNRFDIAPISIGKPAAADWKEQIRGSTRIMLTGMLLHPVVASAERKQEARRQVIAAARIALSDASDDDLIPTMLENAFRKIDDGDEMEPEALPGLFRAFLMQRLPEWQDAIGAESVMLVIQQTLDHELSDRPITDDQDLVDKIMLCVNFGFAFRQGRELSVEAIRDEIIGKVIPSFDGVIDDSRQLEEATDIARKEVDRLIAGGERWNARPASDFLDDDVLGMTVIPD